MSAFRKLSAYVLQEDLLYAELTVRDLEFIYCKDLYGVHAGPRDDHVERAVPSS